MLEGGLTGKVAVVTGAAGGIGGAVATAFADAGAEVVGLDREQADLSVADEVESFFAGLERVDILFNGAGISGRRFGDGPVDDAPRSPGTPSSRPTSRASSSARSTPFLCCGRPEAARSSTSASIHGLVGGDADFATHAYAASKAGIVGLTRAMAVHYAREEIRCNAIAPGLIRTPMSQRAQSDPGILARLPELQPLTGDFGRPEDVAGAALYLATAPFVTGTVLVVDGGWTAK